MLDCALTKALRSRPGLICDEILLACCSARLTFRERFRPPAGTRCSSFLARVKNIVICAAFAEVRGLQLTNAHTYMWCVAKLLVQCLSPTYLHSSSSCPGSISTSLHSKDKTRLSTRVSIKEAHVQIFAGTCRSCPAPCILFLHVQPQTSPPRLCFTAALRSLPFAFGPATAY